MTFTEQKKKEVMRQLKGKMTSGCPMCDHRSWTIGDELVAAPATSLEGGIAIGGPFVPMVQVICQRCGFVSHHAAGALGIDLN